MNISSLEQGGQLSFGIVFEQRVELSDYRFDPIEALRCVLSFDGFLGRRAVQGTALAVMQGEARGPHGIQLIAGEFYRDQDVLLQVCWLLSRSWPSAIP